MSETYSVVVSGQLVEGFELHQVKVNMTQAFKLSEAQVDKLLCGKPVALKRGIEKNLAVKLSQRLQDLGVVSVIKAAPSAEKTTADNSPVVKAAAASEPQAQQTDADEPHSPEVSPVASEPEAEVNAVPPATDNADNSEVKNLDCPRCGHSQPVSNSCQLCNMDLTLHLRRTERRARVVANILKERQASNN